MTRSVDYHQDGKSLSQNTGNQVKRENDGNGECGNACGTDPLWCFSIFHTKSNTRFLFLNIKKKKKTDAFNCR